MISLRVGCESHCDGIKDFGSEDLGLFVLDNESLFKKEGERQSERNGGHGVIFVSQ